MDLNPLLKLMMDKRASDLFITAGMPPCLKVAGKLVPVTRNALSEEQVSTTVFNIMSDKQKDEFVTSHECNFTINATGLGRFRVSAFFQRNVAGMVLRRIETKIPTTDTLGIPEIINQLAMTRQGLIIFVGAAGQGKSSSLAAMIDHRNENSRGHIVSIEDPIEFLHNHKGCIVTQREVGVDTDSFEVALRNTLRQAPDVIMIGEVRTLETMKHAITFAETGHLCLATLHASNANQALDRIIHFFPADQHQQIWNDLALNLKAIIAQQLVKTPDGKGRKAVTEILINTPLVADLIRKGSVHELKSLMARSTELGMQTFDQSLYERYNNGEITYEDAIAHADSANNLRLMIKLGSETDPEYFSATTSGLRVEGDDDSH